MLDARAMPSKLPLRCVSALALLGIAFVAVDAAALQPLKIFVDSARTTNNQRKEASASRRGSEAQADAVLGENLSAIDVRGVYARSQLQPNLGASGANAGTPNSNTTASALNLPRDIYYFSGGITVPLNVGNWERHAAARKSAGAAKAGERATAIEVERSVTQTYFEVVGSEEVLRAVNSRLELAKGNGAVILARAREGESSALDVERTRADVARAQQDVADAEGNLLRARRRLFSLTSVDPQPGTEVALLADDLHDEGPAASWMQRNQTTRPAVARATGQREAAESQRDAAKLDWLPTLSATAAENYTNATESLGRKDFYTVMGLASWHVDLTKSPKVRAQNAALDGAKAAEAQARIDSQDAVYDAWVQVQQDIAKARASRVGALSSRHALDLAREQYAAGEATQVDVLTAEQTFVEAEVARVRVDADLAYARAALRLSVADGNDPAAK